MNPQQHLNALFLTDTYRLWKDEKSSATKTVARLRLYLAATGYEQSLRGLFLAGGFTEKEYERLLFCYNQEFRESNDRYF